jgi:large subunit ribosomal protein L5
MEKHSKARLEELYVKDIRPELQKELGLKNIMEVPKIEKIVVNVGVTGSITDSKLVQTVAEAITDIAGQTAVRTKSKKSIAGFKLRENMPIGVKVTLRKKRMYEFLDKLINLALPKVRDFQGVNPQLDGQGNYNLGIKEWIIFPELDQGFNEKTFGMNITIQTSAKKDEHGYALLKKFNMPFRTQGKR